jgi:lycopene cyclase domain-containing protein
VTYTWLALAGLAFALLLDLVVLRTRLVRRRAFWVAYAIIIVFQLISNGVLTYRHIVRYNPGSILGLRIAGAPIEDIVFGFSLVLQTLAWWIWWGCRLGSATTDRRTSEPVRRATAPDRRPRAGGGVSR